MESLRKICLIDDGCNWVGGTSLTLEAIIEPNKPSVHLVGTHELSLKHAFANYEMFIFGNITQLNVNTFDVVEYIMLNRNFVKIEFDYGYCTYRGDIPHRILGNSECDCPQNQEFKPLYDLILTKSKHIFYMSQAQMEKHESRLGKTNVPKKVLSSCFTKDTMLLFNQLKTNPKNNKYAIIDGQPGWHSQAKGIQESIKYAKEKNIDFDLIKTKTYSEMLPLLSKYKGLISLPTIEDTCPRITLEARYLGLDVITNENSQHITEEWWNSSDEDSYNFTLSRPDFFWETLKCLK